jgi:hypothetical protein
MSSSCFETGGSSSGRLFYIQLCYVMFCMLKLPFIFIYVYLDFYIVCI